MINPFTGTGFDVVSLTTAINKIPNQYGLLNQIGLFAPEPVAQRTVLVEQFEGVLNLLPTKPVGAPGTLGSVGKRTMRSFAIPHIPHDDTVLPQEVHGIRAFGSEDATDTVAALLARKLAMMRAKHAITLEYLRMGALKGIVLDADASTLYNWYTEFSIVQKTINFALNNAATDVMAKVLEMKRHMEDNLKGETMSGILVLCSQEFIDALTSHTKVQEAWKYYQVNNQNLAGDYRLGFQYGGGAGIPVLFREYRGTSSDPDGTARPFIAAKEAHAFPLGTQDTFKTLFAPADFNETVNTLGQELYAKLKQRDFERGWDIHTQSNPLPICKRPELLVKLTTP